MTARGRWASRSLVTRLNPEVGEHVRQHPYLFPPVALECVCGRVVVQVIERGALIRIHAHEALATEPGKGCYIPTNSPDPSSHLDEATVVELARVPRRSAGERLEACGAGARRGAAEGSVAAEDIDIDIDIDGVVVVARVERDSASGARARFVGARGTTWTSARA